MFRLNAISTLSVFSLALIACATAPGPDRGLDDDEDDVVGGGADGGTGSGDGANGLVDAVPGASQVLRATASDDIVNGNSVACLETSGVVHFENHYYRVFELASFGVASDFRLSEVLRE